MDQLDVKLLDLIQRDFPIENRPFLSIGVQLGIGENEVIDRLKILKEQGYFRRLGATFDSKKLGYQSTLCAMKVPEHRIDDVSRIINEYPGVTHNYLRNHPYNMWFTLISPSRAMIEETLLLIKNRANIDTLLNLPATNFFKINVHFHLSGGN